MLLTSFERKSRLMSLVFRQQIGGLRKSWDVSQGCLTEAGFLLGGVCSAKLSGLKQILLNL
jgi:hypothetical protein